MNNPNNIEKFDALFKDAAFDYELPYNKDAWDLMQKKLDKKNTNKKFFLMLFSVLVLFCGVASLFIFNNFTNNPNSLINNTSDNKNLSSFDSVSSSTQNPSQNEFEPNKIEILEKNEVVSSVKPTTNNENNHNKNTKENYVISPYLHKKSTNNNLNITINKPQKNNQSLKTNFDNLTTSSNQIKKNITDGIDEKISINQNQIKSTSKELNIPKPEINNNIIVKKEDYKLIENKLNKIASIPQNNLYVPVYTSNNTNLYWMHNKYANDLEKLALENANLIDKITKQLELNERINQQAQNEATVKYLKAKRAFEMPSSRWFAMVAGAGNIGYVSNPQIGKTNFQLLLSVGYNVSKHVSFQTGIILGNRQFDVRKDQYDYTGPSLYNKYITNINADISLVDIPITFRYQFSETENKGLFFTAGFSSLFMKKENYQVNLSSTNPSFVEQDFQKTRSIFTLLNLSAGYQYLLNKKISVLLEPYIQLPFDNIGKGNIKMSSVGLQIGAKYNFLRKKKQ